MKSKSDRLKSLLTLCLLLGVIGLILIFFSSSFGTSLADSWLSRTLEQTGGADPTIYQFKARAFANSFLVTGGILFGVSLIMILFVYYKMLKMKE